MAAHNGKFSLIDNRHGSGSALVLSVITVTESRVFRTAAHACSFTESGRALGPRSLIASGQRRERKGRIERDNVAPAAIFEGAHWAALDPRNQTRRLPDCRAADRRCGAAANQTGLRPLRTLSANRRGNRAAQGHVNRH